MNFLDCKYKILLVVLSFLGTDLLLGPHKIVRIEYENRFLQNSDKLDPTGCYYGLGFSQYKSIVDELSVFYEARVRFIAERPESLKVFRQAYLQNISKLVRDESMDPFDRWCRRLERYRCWLNDFEQQIDRMSLKICSEVHRESFKKHLNQQFNIKREKYFLDELLSVRREEWFFKNIQNPKLLKTLLVFLGLGSTILTYQYVL